MSLFDIDEPLIPDDEDDAPVEPAPPPLPLCGITPVVPIGPPAGLCWPAPVAGFGDAVLG
ncbi:MAG: hypothetical protein JWQ03_1460, partial [Variovorax sp.]|nr:hypothetical protein [Variovorax sp.]